LELPLLQSWLPAPEKGFLPGSARFSWGDGLFRLEATFIGDVPTSRATAHGQRLWELGDVAELFVQKVGQESYREYQVSPNGFTLALRYPDTGGVASLRSGSRMMDEFFAGEIPAVACTSAPEGWRAFLEIPLPACPGDSFRVSCCRYAYPKEGSPVISSTSLHPVRDFHRPQDWTVFTVRAVPLPDPAS